jgi:hypothetical protein
MLTRYAAPFWAMRIVMPALVFVAATMYHWRGTLISDRCVPWGRTGFDGVVGRANASRAPGS